MRRIIFFFIFILISVNYSHGQMKMNKECPQNDMHSMSYLGQNTMMNQPMSHMMMYDMNNILLEILNIQEIVVKSSNIQQKKQLTNDISKLKEKISMMKSMCKNMMMKPDDTQDKIKCAIEWLKKSIDLHDIHIKDPKTATEDSQIEMMEQMKKAYECLTGTAIAPSKHEMKDEKSNSHKH